MPIVKPASSGNH